ncbi:MAG: hypothetical protein J2P28_09485 [Actinobacteria bacterium]|nr:hypothetical protein [Actinomycetota bacterium]
MAALVIGANVIIVPIAVAGLASPGVGNAVGAAVVAIIMWVIWLLGWWSKVVIGPHGVTVDNMIMRHVIAWEQLGDIHARSGLTFELTDGSRIGSLTYGASLAGDLTGWKGLRRVREQMLAARPVRSADAPPANRERRTRIKIAWWPIAVYLMPLEAIAIASGMGHHEPLF